MIEFLFYASIACTDAVDMVNRVRVNESVHEVIRTEVIETIKEATPECNWDAND
tara:strand:+ start:359 stop:520 length:162 start_codon:yes stop_codon:yes gene_type:complete